jgi:uncharacterized protein (DUF983 family)
MSNSYRYPPLSPVRTGLAGRCPRCGQGNMFDGFLTIAKSCRACGLDFSPFDSADGPAVIIMLVVGFAVMGAALAVEVAWEPPYWVHAVLWGPLIVALPLALLRPLKGIFLAGQYRANASEGRLADGSD